MWVRNNWAPGRVSVPANLYLSLDCVKRKVRFTPALSAHGEDQEDQAEGDNGGGQDAPASVRLPQHPPSQERRQDDGTLSQRGNVAHLRHAHGEQNEKVGRDTEQSAEDCGSPASLPHGCQTVRVATPEDDGCHEHGVDPHQNDDVGDGVRPRDAHLVHDGVGGDEGRRGDGPGEP